MNAKFAVIMVAAFIGMGMSMPSCPGQQALQQQVDTLTTSNAELSKRVQGMDAQVKQLNMDMSQVKQLLKPMSDAIQAQKAGMDQLDSNIKEIQAKMTAPKASAKSAAKGKPAAKKHR
jgi:septal ring factor EnvC (AmiA/AmiB activator)